MIRVELSRGFRVASGECFVLSAGVRERTDGCSPRAPRRFGLNRLGGLVSGQFRDRGSFQGLGEMEFRGCNTLKLATF